MSRHRMPFTALRAFEAAARHLSVSLAAQELFVTPGAVSQQVQQLEGWVGVPLFARLGKRIELTAEGRQLRERLVPLFDQLERALDEVKASTAPRTLRLRLAPTLAIRWLVPNLADFIGRHPEIDVEVNTVASAEERSLDDVDLAVRFGTTIPESEDALELFRDAFVPVCSPATAHLLRDPADLDRVPRLHSIIRPESWGIWLAHAGLDLDPHAGPKFANAALAYQAAADGLGVAIGQKTYVAADLRSGRLVAPFDIVARSPKTYYLVNARHKSSWPKVRQFRSWCEELVRRESAQA